jgi:hypothetical protein
MHIRAGAKGSVGFVIFKEKLFAESLDLQTSQVFEAKSLPPGCPNRVKTGPDDPETGLPKYPRKQTFPASVGMSQTCQQRTPNRA